LALSLRGDVLRGDYERKAGNPVSILWIILIVILVLALLGFFSRGRW
jgi:flagellar basal body-associated protein FliL